MSAKGDKPLTPAQTAKKFVERPNPAVSQAAAPSAKKAESVTNESATATAHNDTVKAIEKLETRTKAVNANNVARVANSQLTSNDEKLSPMLSLKTGKPIEKFPSTSKDIQKLGLVALDGILNALEADRTGNEEVKREKVRVQLGLKATPA